MEWLIILSAACAAVSFTISWTSIFEPLRERVSTWHPKLEELIHCPWCLNHYIVLVGLALSSCVTSFSQFILQWFAAVGIGGLIHAVLLIAYKPVAEREMWRKKRQKNNSIDNP